MRNTSIALFGRKYLQPQQRTHREKSDDFFASIQRLTIDFILNVELERFLECFEMFLLSSGHPINLLDEVHDVLASSILFTDISSAKPKIKTSDG